MAGRAAKQEATAGQDCAGDDQEAMNAVRFMGRLLGISA